MAALEGRADRLRPLGLTGSGPFEFCLPLLGRQTFKRFMRTAAHFLKCERPFGVVLVRSRLKFQLPWAATFEQVLGIP